MQTETASLAGLKKRGNRVKKGKKGRNLALRTVGGVAEEKGANVGHATRKKGTEVCANTLEKRGRIPVIKK